MKEGYAIVELMGHRRYGAKVSEVERFGAKFLHCQVLTDPPFEQIVSPSAIYSLTECTEEQAREACGYRAYVPDELRQLGAGSNIPDAETFDEGEESDEEPDEEGFDPPEAGEEQEEDDTDEDDTDEDQQPEAST